MGQRPFGARGVAARRFAVPARVRGARATADARHSASAAHDAREEIQRGLGPLRARRARRPSRRAPGESEPRARRRGGGRRPLGLTRRLLAQGAAARARAREQGCRHAARSLGQDVFGLRARRERGRGLRRRLGEVLPAECEVCPDVVEVGERFLAGGAGGRGEGLGLNEFVARVVGLAQPPERVGLLGEAVGDRALLAAERIVDVVAFAEVAQRHRAMPAHQLDGAQSRCVSPTCSMSPAGSARRSCS